MAKPTPARFIAIALSSRYTGCMRKAITALLILALAGAFSSAQEDKPTLPRVPRGFDEGRKDIVQEAGDGLIDPGALIERLFEYADLTTQAEFIHLHLTKGEKAVLDAQLKLGGKLASTSDLVSVLAALDGKKTKSVSAALGQSLEARKFKTTDVVAWLAARGFNFRAIQKAMNGERIDAFRVKASVRKADAAKALTVGVWEYNLVDAREEKGGHYNGVQLVEAMLALGFTLEDFEWVNLNADRAASRKMSPYEHALVRWGDPVLIWGTLNARIPESTLFKAIVKRHTDAAKAREVAELRADTTLRWFRTGGAGVKAVYRGPWPDNTGAPVPPTEHVDSIGDVDVKQFAAGLNEEVLAHFSAPAETLTIVVYEDGSSRAILDKPKREAVNYGHASPFGNVDTTRQCYEGRVSLSGKSALMYLVYNNDQKVAPPQFELANVNLISGEAFMAADIDDGLNLTPILLKRITRLVE